ncbi:leucine-rich repeat-containing protein kinase family protein [Leptothoe kymatousa]|uniref:Serine/threonine-protein kinase n=1 Tax=Leptothoe kymatousa TAU-MAC 1615 TaxID=2364775 RepID=A0ABS5Y0B6_9CYAN|nr:leucine-rich repeat-containing protein kinase family protein [Leptothoe kymatousa]MBT9311271.1 serine/threonine-protein kinase [Leptothoe kymatousa TAU-MAC 1615]
MKSLSLDLETSIGEPRLKLADNLTEFPLEILEQAESLEILDLSNNQLKTLPDEFARLKKLRIAFFNNNQFEEFPEVLAKCPNLSMVSFKGNRLHTIRETALSPNIRWLILTNNQLTQLPKSIGTLTKLQKCMLAGNQLSALPGEMANCKSIELLRLAANRFESLPDWLFTLPRLTWLAYAGNPCCQPTAAQKNAFLAIIEPEELQLGEVLGQGASGVIYKAQWQSGGPSGLVQDVAVKLFKGEMTSDGLPLDEMQACIAAGTHPNLVNVLGKLGQPIDGKAGLVFAYIANSYSNLGNPPSLETCTRDTYPEDASFSLPMILKIAYGIASVVTHLHARGIMHGDLYAHNILINARGKSILGDFGAASFFDLDAKPTAQAFQWLESRAFGCLLEDLLDRYGAEAVDGEAATMEQLRVLQQQCMAEEPSKRPLFETICQTLSTASQMG